MPAHWAVGDTTSASDQLASSSHKAALSALAYSSEGEFTPLRDRVQQAIENVSCSDDPLDSTLFTMRVIESIRSLRMKGDRFYEGAPIPPEFAEEAVGRFESASKNLLERLDACDRPSRESAWARDLLMLYPESPAVVHTLAQSEKPHFAFGEPGRALLPVEAIKFLFMERHIHLSQWQNQLTDEQRSYLAENWPSLSTCAQEAPDVDSMDSCITGTYVTLGSFTLLTLRVGMVFCRLRPTDSAALIPVEDQTVFTKDLIRSIQSLRPGSGRPSTEHAWEAVSRFETLAVKAERAIQRFLSEGCAQEAQLRRNAIGYLRLYPLAPPVLHTLVPSQYRDLPSLFSSPEVAEEVFIHRKVPLKTWSQEVGVLSQEAQRTLKVETRGELSITVSWSEYPEEQDVELRSKIILTPTNQLGMDHFPLGVDHFPFGDRQGQMQAGYEDLQLEGYMAWLRTAPFLDDGLDD